MRSGISQYTCSVPATITDPDCGCDESAGEGITVPEMADAPDLETLLADEPDLDVLVSDAALADLATDLALASISNLDS